MGAGCCTKAVERSSEAGHRQEAGATRMYYQSYLELRASLHALNHPIGIGFGESCEEAADDDDPLPEESDFDLFIICR